MAEEDLLFGKNRHFFGGIEPSNMTNFGVSADNGFIKVTATLPDNTVANGQTLCTVEGAVIRRKANNYPINEFDGDLVANIKISTSFVDTGVSDTDTLYYAAFPYTTQGVYNRNKENRAAVNIPEPMVEFSATSGYIASTGSDTVEITAKLPSGVTGAIIRKSTSGYPNNENDGYLVANITADGTYTDSNVVVGTTYYYAAFTYIDEGTCYYNELNRISFIPTKNCDYLFGYDLNLATSSPTDRVTYPSDTNNASFTPAAMNYTMGKFDYGSWNFAAGEKFMPRPCMLSYNGVVDHYLDPNDYTKKIDGTDSRVSDTSFGGNAMVEWPKIYTKRWEENGVYHFRCSDVPHGDDWDCWCNYDKNNNQIDHFYTPIYSGSVIDGRLRSISGTSNITTLTITDAVTYAVDKYYLDNTNSGWYIEFLADKLLIQDLLVMMAKSTDCQTAYGYGRCKSTNESPLSTGYMNTVGMFWGEDDQVSSLKVFGMEHPWGNLERWVAGWSIENGVQKVKITWGTHDSSRKSKFFNISPIVSENKVIIGYHASDTGGADHFITLSDATPSGTTGGYISSMKTTPWGRIPVITNGSSTTYEADCLVYQTSSDVKYANLGGHYQNGYAAGPFCATMDTNTTSSNFVGVGISCKPTA